MSDSNLRFPGSYCYTVRIFVRKKIKDDELQPKVYSLYLTAPSHVLESQIKLIKENDPDIDVIMYQYINQINLNEVDNVLSIPDDFFKSSLKEGDFENDNCGGDLEK